jgi:alcohol dehydrogenase class IV
VHACAHALGAVKDMHHGLANALMIDTVLAWNMEAVPVKFDTLAQTVGVAGGGAGFIDWLKAIKGTVGITGGLAQRGVVEADIARMAHLAEIDFTSGTNPRPAKAQDYARLLRAAL